MEERVLQPRESQGPTIADEPAAPASTPCDDGGDALLAPVVQLLLSSSGDDSSSSSSSSDDEGERELDFEFEFPFVSRDSPAGTAAPADELFADGRIRTTLYPVFGRAAGCFSSSSSSHGDFTAAPPAEKRVRGRLGKLFLEETTRERNSSTSSSSSSGAGTDDDGLDGAAPESYCVWRPNPSPSATAPPSPAPPPRTRKSGSTGSMARWRRISDLVVGRSHSDGREKFLFLSAAAAAPPARSKRPPAPAATAAAAGGAAYRKPPPPPAVAAPATDAEAAAAAHRIAHLARAGLGGGTPRRTFLPYREELLGFFASVNGISRSHHHPF